MCKPVLSLILVVVGATSVHAQTRPAPRPAPKWSIEVYGGQAGSSKGTGSGLGQFPTGPTFATEDTGRLSRAVSSWYFGDGAALFNEVAADFAARYGQNYPRITPLDAVLTSGSARRQGGSTFGLRLTRWFASRVGFEISFDRSKDPFALTDDAEQAIAATRASFHNAFTGLLGVTPVTLPVVTSTTQLPGSIDETQMSVLVGVTVAVAKPGPVRVLVSFGGGGVFSNATSLVAKLQGNYRFTMLGINPINESDAVTIHFTDKDLVPVGSAGLGVSIDLARRHGIRVEARVRVSENTTRITVDSAPSVTAVAPFIFFSSQTDPSLQFSTTAGVRTSLSGEPVTGLETFSPGGLDMRTVFTVGYFFRF